MIHETKKIIKDAGFSFANSPQELVAALIRDSLRLESETRQKPKALVESKKPSESDQSGGPLDTDRQEQPA